MGRIITWNYLNWVLSFLMLLINLFGHPIGCIKSRAVIREEEVFILMSRIGLILVCY